MGGEEVLGEEVLEVALQVRPDRIAAAAFALLPPSVQRDLRPVSEALGQLALAEPVVLPASTLRARLLDAVRHRPRRRALVVVDMINDHLAPGRILEVPRARAIVPALQARLAAARQEGVPVVYVVDRHSPDDTDLDDWGQHAIEGSEGAQVWPPLAPASGDHVVPKPSYSGFFRSSLEKVLTELRVDTIELTGCSTEVQLVATATDALQLGFAVEVPPTLQAGTTEEAEQAALQTLRFLVPYQPARDARLSRVSATM